MQSPIENQSRISERESKLIPRYSPQIPPKPEMECIQVIIGDLSNSGPKIIGIFIISIFGSPNTVESPKKDVDDGNVLFICNVGHLFLKDYGKWDFMFGDLKFAIPWY